MATLAAIAPKNAFILLLEKTANIYVTVSILTAIILMDACIRREQFLQSQVCSLNSYFLKRIVIQAEQFVKNYIF